MGWWSFHKQGTCLEEICGVTITLPSYDPDKVTQSLAAQGIDPQDAAEVEEEKSEMKKRQPKVALPDLVILLDYPNTTWAAHEAHLADIPGISIFYV